MNNDELRTLILDDVYYVITLVVLGLNSFGIGLILGQLL